MAAVGEIEGSLPLAIWAQMASFGDTGWVEGEAAWTERTDGLTKLRLFSRSRGFATLSQHPLKTAITYGGGAAGFGNHQFAYVSGSNCYAGAVEGSLQCIWEGEDPIATPVAEPEGRGWLFTRHGQQRGLQFCGPAGSVHLARRAAYLMQPQWSSDGSELAWVEWDHPKMPWDRSRLLRAPVRWADGLPQFGQPFQVTTDAIAYFQPQYTQSGDLLFAQLLEDWELVRLGSDGQITTFAQPGLQFGRPLWVNGLRTYAYDATRNCVWALAQRGAEVQLLQVDLQNAQLKPHSSPFQVLSQPSLSGDQLLLIGEADDCPPSLCIYDVETAQWQTLATAAPLSFDQTQLVRGQQLQLGRDADPLHGILYQPRVRALDDAEGRSPLLLNLHGGPTSCKMHSFSELQWFVSQGWSLLELNYRGSSGFGRSYRDALVHRWGLAEVEDCQRAVNFLVEHHQIDPKRCVIMGGSAGGYSVLRLLLDHPGLFAAGVCRYGIADLEILIDETHEFEQHYLEQLIAPVAQLRQVAKERSPIHQLSQLRTPLAIFHGGKDKVVPVSQSQLMAEALQQNGVEHLLEIFPEEGHGFKRQQNREQYFARVQQFLEQTALKSN